MLFNIFDKCDFSSNLTMRIHVNEKLKDKNSLFFFINTHFICKISDN